MSIERDLIERLVFSGTVTRGDVVIEVRYDPLTYSTEGLDDSCFYCDASPTWNGEHRGAVHEPDCAWVEAMRYLGHELPAGHLVEEAR